MLLQRLLQLVPASLPLDGSSGAGDGDDVGIVVAVVVVGDRFRRPQLEILRLLNLRTTEVWSRRA